MAPFMSRNAPAHLYWCLHLTEHSAMPGPWLAIDPHGISVSPNVSPEDEAGSTSGPGCTPGVGLHTGWRGSNAPGGSRCPRFQVPFNHPTAAAAPDGDIYVADGRQLDGASI